MTTHVVESTADTVRSGYLDPAAKPVATVASGDTVSALAPGERQVVMGVVGQRIASPCQVRLYEVG